MYRKHFDDKRPLRGGQSLFRLPAGAFLRGKCILRGQPAGRFPGDRTGLIPGRHSEGGVPWKSGGKCDGTMLKIHSSFIFFCRAYHIGRIPLPLERGCPPVGEVPRHTIPVPPENGDNDGKIERQRQDGCGHRTGDDPAGIHNGIRRRSRRRDGRRPGWPGQPRGDAGRRCRDEQKRHQRQAHHPCDRFPLPGNRIYRED